MCFEGINTEDAKQLPGVLAVVTGEDACRGKSCLDAYPLLRQANGDGYRKGSLSVAQEVAFVVAEDPCIAADNNDLVEVDYEELPVLVDPHKALDPDAPILRDDRGGQSNHVFHWEVGDRAATDKVFEDAEVKAKVHAVFQRCHPAPAHPRGVRLRRRPQLAATGRLAPLPLRRGPHAHHALFAIVSGIPENNIRVISPDIGVGGSAQ